MAKITDIRGGRAGAGEPLARSVRADRLPVERPPTIAEWRPTFLNILTQTGNVYAASKAAGITTREAKTHKAFSPQFSDEWDDALEGFASVIELVMLDRIKKGSDYLLYRMAQAVLPDKYGNKTTIKHELTQKDRKAIYDMAIGEGLTDEQAKLIVADVEAEYAQGGKRHDRSVAG